MGGNLFEIVYLQRKSLNHLHTFWDATAHQYSEVKVPLTDTSYAKLQGYAENVTAEFPRGSADLKTEMTHKTFDSWIDESGEKAKTSAYFNLEIHSGDTITDEYLEQA
jgi:hypothetical protein